MTTRAALSVRSGTSSWQRFDIRRIEDLSNAVLGAELQAVQMTGPPVRGSLAFAARRGVIFSSGLIESAVTVAGQLSREAITLAIGLRFGPNSRQWLNLVTDGTVGVVLPGDQHDAFYTRGSLYAAAALSARRLREEAKREGLVLDRRMIARTGVHPVPIAQRPLIPLRQSVVQLHRHGASLDDSDTDVGRVLLRTVIEHYARVPALANGGMLPTGRARVVAHARDYIDGHLALPLTLDAIAAATGTSLRTLSRAFVEVLGDAPGDYVRRLRLHRIRRDLICAAHDDSIARIAAKWGLQEPGRMSGWYRELFGELPSATRAAGLAGLRMTAEQL